jgi:hypothetical protein
MFLIWYKQITYRGFTKYKKTNLLLQMLARPELITFDM